MNGSYVSYIKRILPLKQLALLFALSVFAIGAGFIFYSSISKDIQVSDNGKPVVAKTMGMSVKQALDRMDISVGDADYLSMPLNSILDPDSLNVIEIKRAVPVNLRIDGQTRQVMSYKDTVKEVVEENGIVLGELDRYEGVSPDDPVKAGMEIHVVRVKEEILAEQEYIPYDVVERPNNSMNSGETKVVTAGQNGVKEKYYKIIYEDGIPISKTFLNEKIIKQALSQVVEFGTVLNFRNSRGDVVRYTKKLNMKATAYTASYEDTGKHPDHPAFGITYTGIRVREGVIAVDPKVIPLGTKVYVEVPGPAPDYGFAIAADIGSAIKGNLIDLYFDSKEKARSWGRRNVVVYILKEQNDTRWKQNDNPCE